MCAQALAETPRERIGEKNLEDEKSDAFRWLQENFGKEAMTNRTARGDNDLENRPPMTVA